MAPEVSLRLNNSTSASCADRVSPEFSTRVSVPGALEGSPAGRNENRRVAVPESRLVMFSPVAKGTPATVRLLTPGIQETAATAGESDNRVRRRDRIR